MSPANWYNLLSSVVRWQGRMEGGEKVRTNESTGRKERKKAG